MDREQRELLAAIWANPADALPRLVYADWLDEHCEEGQPGWPQNEYGLSLAGEYIRLRAAGVDSLDQLSRERLTELEPMVFAACLGSDIARAASEPYVRGFVRVEVSQRVDILPSSPEMYRDPNQLPFFDTPRLDVMPGYLATDGDLRLSMIEDLPSLPAFLQVEGSLHIRAASTTSLPPHLHVGRNLSIESSGITTLPDDIRVVGQIIAGLGQIDEREAERWERHPGLSAEAKRWGLFTTGHRAYDEELRDTPSSTPEQVSAVPIRSMGRQR
jgi:uncharacterized protein (TIGR02996 family)